MPPRHERPRTNLEDEDIVRNYLLDIGRHDLLTKEDEARLGQQVQAGLEAKAKIAEIDERNTHRTQGQKYQPVSPTLRREALGDMKSLMV